MNSYPLEIKVSRPKTGGLIFISLIGIWLSWRLIADPNSFVSAIFPIENLILFTGILGFTFCLITTLLFIKRFFQEEPALIFSPEGIEEQGVLFNVGLIEWEDIPAYRTLKIGATKILLLECSNPQKYIDRTNNPITKWMMKYNLKTYDAPFSISTVTLNISHDELGKLMAKTWGETQLSHVNKTTT